MSKAKLLAGVAGLSLVFGTAVAAQEAAPAAQPAAQECSGLGCIFGSRGDSRAAEARALQDNQRAAEAAAAAEDGAPTRRARGPVATKRADATRSADAATSADATKSPAKKTPTTKPVHTVTIAAEGAEAKQLEKLVAALPREKIKIVKAKGDGERTGADFSVTTALGPNGSAEKAKLFTEQLHIIAGGSVTSVADLEGKVVSFGPDKSAGQLAARKAFEALHVKVDETPLDIDNALDGLSSGDVAAVVMLAPQPIDRLKTVSATGVHLVSWPEGGSLPDGASTATIDAGAYPTLAKPGDTIRAVGVDATLVISTKGAKQGAAKSFLKSLSLHAETLTKRGFDLLKADLQTRSGRRLASADKS